VAVVREQRLLKQPIASTSAETWLELEEAKDRRDEVEWSKA